jgi:methionine synthase I (cobalamin-dependent)
VGEGVVVFDGGLGATLEQFDLTAEDYGGLEGKCLGVGPEVTELISNLEADGAGEPSRRRS